MLNEVGKALKEGGYAIKVLNTINFKKSMHYIMKLNSMHIEYIFSCLKENPSKVRNIKSYLKTVLYNAAVTIDNYYTSAVNHDMYGTD